MIPIALTGWRARPLIAIVVTISSQASDRLLFWSSENEAAPKPASVLFIITANDTNVLQVRRCRGCRVVLQRQPKEEEFHNSSTNKNNNKKRKTTEANDADDDISSHRGVRSFGGMGTLVLSDQRILAYVGATRLFHAQWYDATTTNFQLHIQYSSKNTREPLLCWTVVDAPSLFSAVTSTTTPRAYYRSPTTPHQYHTTIRTTDTTTTTHTSDTTTKYYRCGLGRG
jgi:hypothetical protein